MVLKSFYDAYYFFLLQMGKEFYLMKTELKIEAITERWTDSLQILDKIFGLEKVTRKLVARGGFRGGVRPPKIRKAYVIQS
jgi:hypothetical protein